MAPKTKQDANLLFLWVCLQNSGSTAIDYRAVSEATNLNVGAARMRYSRLKKSLEGFISDDGKVDLAKAGEPTDASETTSSPMKPATPAKKPRAVKRKKVAEPEDTEVEMNVQDIKKELEQMEQIGSLDMKDGLDVKE